MADGEDVEAKTELVDSSSVASTANASPSAKTKQRSSKSRTHVVEDDQATSSNAKRRCVSTACIACRKRKSKCDGNHPACAACSSVYNTECIYDPNSDHRRKGVYKKDIDNLKTRNSTLQTLIEAILNYPEHEVPDLIKQIRTCESLDDVAERIVSDTKAVEEEDAMSEDRDIEDDAEGLGPPSFEKELSGKMGKVRLDNGSLGIIGGTSNLIYMDSSADDDNGHSVHELDFYASEEEPVTSWTTVTSDARLILHLMNMYFTWHYTYFVTLSKSLFWRDFKQGRLALDPRRKTAYCSPLLVNAILALGCHFTSWPEARENPDDSSTAGDHFIKEAKRLLLENNEHEKPHLTTVQALALMSVREAGCGREARGWVYSGMSFRMACDLGLNIESGTKALDETEVDARRITIWGCFLFDKCWSNYLGRQPQLPLSTITAPKFDVLPTEEAELWKPHFDVDQHLAHIQPSRTRAVAMQISLLCEISGDLLTYFYHPSLTDRPAGKQAELKRLSELHTRLEAWRKNLPKEMEPREGQLPSILLMHMFFQLLYVHLFRPFLKYKPSNTPLPAHVSPRRFLIHAAAAISKLLRLYRRTYGLRQICNVAVYIVHIACTVHVLNLPDKLAARDLVYGLGHLEEIAESWPCARRTLGILQQVSQRWHVDLPDAAQRTFERIEDRYGPFRSQDSAASPRSEFPSRAHTDTSLHQLPLQSSDFVAPSQPQLFPLSNGDYLPGSVPPPPTPSTLALTPDSSLSLPPQQAEEFLHLSRQHKFVVTNPPQTHQQRQRRTSHPDGGRGTSNSRQSNSGQGGRGQVNSPSQLFGGVDSLMQDQEWWLQDSHQMFANWNGLDYGASNQQMPAEINEAELTENGLHFLGNGVPMNAGGGGRVVSGSGGGGTGRFMNGTNPTL